MKKTTLLLFALTTLLSCSKDNDTNELPLTAENLSGTWYFKESIAPDGTVTPYLDSYCGDRERWDMFLNSEFDYYNYTLYDDGTCGLENHGMTWYISDERILILFNYDDPYVKSLTENEMRLEYTEDDGSIRTEVLTRI